MSYCRWSSMDFACDLYCFESERGYETHVANVRVVGTVPHVDFFGGGETFVAQYKAQHDFLESAAHEEIGGPYDGESFTDADLEGFEARLRHLRSVGYRFPEEVFHAVWAEMAEEIAGRIFSETDLHALIFSYYPTLPGDSLTHERLAKMVGEAVAQLRPHFVEQYVERCALLAHLLDQMALKPDEADPRIIDPQVMA